jgi:hypothetical protein
MRKRSLRLALTAALLCGSAFLMACPLGYLRVLIPDYLTSDVRGIRIYRIDDATGELAAAGHIEFLALDKSKIDQTGQTLKYKQFNADGAPWFGPIYTPVIRDPAQPAAIEITLSMLNQLPAGYFKIASYNQYGTSPPSTGQTFIIGEEG